jgi:mono/diheme cytochrome c family protein
MQDQPKMKPYRSTSFFGDGLSMRQPIPGTVARGFLRTDKELFTGKKDGATTGSGTASASPQAPGAGQQATGAGQQAGGVGQQAGGAGQQTGGAGQQGGQQASGPEAYPDDVTDFPFPITKETVQRGRERYEIFCSVCHGLTGAGDGMIVRRGFRQAASFHEDRLRKAPVGHFFDAITNGWGAMPSYAPQIPVQDRWAIIAYVRALQLSQQNAQPKPSPVPGSSPLPSSTQSSGGHQ